MEAPERVCEDRPVRPRASARRASCFAIACFPLLIAAVPAGAREVVPFHSFNQSPVVQIFGLPALGPARLGTPGTTRIELSEIVARNATGSIREHETLVLDGESYRTTLIVAHTVATGIELGIEIPYVAIGAGRLDGAVGSFHDAVGLDHEDDLGFDRDEFRYTYAREGVEELAVVLGANGIGDVRLTAGWQWRPSRPERRLDVALRGSVELPTGDSSALLGSGGTEVALWASLAERQDDANAGLQWYGGFGAVYVGAGDVLRDRQRRFVGFAGVGAGWAVGRAFVLKAQVDLHSPFYRDSDVGQLADPAAQLLVGATWEIGEKGSFDFALAEDVIVDNSSDVALHFGLRWRR